jgi:hypothetical protein
MAILPIIVSNSEFAKSPSHFEANIVHFKPHNCLDFLSTYFKDYHFAEESFQIPRAQKKEPRMPTVTRHFFFQ